MMQTMGERLQEALDRRGVKPVDLIAGTKLSKGTIYNILGDKTRPEKVWADTATRVCRYLRISRDWLISGRGPMDTEESPSQVSGPDPAILQEAVSLLLFDLDHGGPRSATSASRLLMDLYRRIEAAGGHLPDDEQARFEAEARTRGQTLDRKLQEAGRGKR